MDMEIFYGSELFDNLGGGDLWGELTALLRDWKHRTPEHAMPNFDADVQETLQELRNIPPKTWKKIAENNEIWDEGIMAALFPTGAALEAIVQRFHTGANWANTRIAQGLTSRLVRYYGKTS